MIQDVLLERARRFDVPVIENSSLDDAIGEVLDLVLTGAEQLRPHRVGAGSTRPAARHGHDDCPAACTGHGT